MCSALMLDGAIDRCMEKPDSVITAATSFGIIFLFTWVILNP
jgi:hypothetical protein